MTEWEGTLEQRNKRALKMWRHHAKLVRDHGVNPFPDAQQPAERAYLIFSYSRKLEVARSFLDRLRYMQRWTRELALISRPS